jgi:hypothetical protein
MHPLSSNLYTLLHSAHTAQNPFFCRPECKRTGKSRKAAHFPQALPAFYPQQKIKTGQARKIRVSTRVLYAFIFPYSTKARRKPQSSGLRFKRHTA